MKKSTIITLIVIALCLAIIIFGVLLNTSKKKQAEAARTRIYTVDDALLANWAVELPNTENDISKFINPFDAENSKVIHASDIKTPILMIICGTIHTDDERVSNTAADGFSFAYSDNIDFTQDITKANTILYVTSGVYKEWYSLYREYTLYALSLDGSQCHLVNALGDVFGRQTSTDCQLNVPYESSNAENDDEFFHFFELRFNLSDDATNDINSVIEKQVALEALDRKLKTTAGEVLANAYRIMEQTALTQETNIEKHPELLPADIKAYWLFYYNNCPEKVLYGASDGPTDYTRTSYQEWITLVRAFYIQTEADAEEISNRVDLPSNIAIVAEKVAAGKYGTYVKLGDVYIYRERYTVVDLVSEKVLCWDEGYPGIGTAGTNSLILYGDDIDASYPKDAYGRRITGGHFFWGLPDTVDAEFSLSTEVILSGE